MTTIFIQPTLDGGHNIKLQSDDPLAFKACIERLKVCVPSLHRVYNPATKTWLVDEFAYHAMQQWLNHCRGSVGAKVEWLDADASGQSEQEWTPPQRPRQAKADDAFKVLHLLPTAPASVVKAAYKALSLEFHPDRPTGNTRKQQQLNAAYEALSKQVAA